METQKYSSKVQVHHNLTSSTASVYTQFPRLILGIQLKVQNDFIRVRPIRPDQKYFSFSVKRPSKKITVTFSLCWHSYSRKALQSQGATQPKDKDTDALKYLCYCNDCKHLSLFISTQPTQALLYMTTPKNAVENNSVSVIMNLYVVCQGFSSLLCKWAKFRNVLQRA